MPTDTDPERRSSDEVVSQAQALHGEQVVTHPETRDGTRLDSAKSTLPTARTKYRPQISVTSQCKGPTLDAFPYLSSSRQVQEAMNKGRGKRDERQSKTAAVRYSHARQQSGPTSTGDLPLIDKKRVRGSINGIIVLSALTVCCYD